MSSVRSDVVEGSRRAAPGISPIQQSLHDLGAASLAPAARETSSDPAVSPKLLELLEKAKHGSTLIPARNSSKSEHATDEHFAPAPERVIFRTFPSPAATSATLCLYDPESPGTEITRHPMKKLSDGSFGCLVEGVGAGIAYGYRLDGPWNPRHGLQFNPHRVLLDPYAQAVVWPGKDGKPDKFGADNYDPQLFRLCRHREEQGSFELLTNDNGAVAPKAVVVDHGKFQWGDDHRVNVAAEKTVIIELHVTGATKMLETLPQPLRGTFAGLATPDGIDTFAGAGTHVQIMPFAAKLTEPFLRGRPSEGNNNKNYWSYTCIAPGAPEPSKCFADDPQGQVDEVKAMVASLHRAGYGVIFDVVFNHTGEGDWRWDPHVSLGGFDATAYWSNGDGYPENWSGCGNTLNMNHPAVRAWAQQCVRNLFMHYHADGVRFDLAALQGISKEGPDHRIVYNPEHAFYKGLATDPAIKPVVGATVQAGYGNDPEQPGLLIAENWAHSPPEAQQQHCPPLGFQSQSGKFRDQVRDIVRNEGHSPEIAEALCGTAGQFSGTLGWRRNRLKEGQDQRRVLLAEMAQREPVLKENGLNTEVHTAIISTAHELASLNHDLRSQLETFTLPVVFTTCHDGFTERDTHTYEHKRNDANGEKNRDGESHNRSHNCGIEGPTENHGVLAKRWRCEKFNVAFTYISTDSIPMVPIETLHRHTRHGNNNGYCQDNELSYINPAQDPSQGKMLQFCRGLLGLRLSQSGLRGSELARQYGDVPEIDQGIHWFSTNGATMADVDWNNGWGQAVGRYCRGAYTMVNASEVDVNFTMPNVPGQRPGQRWLLQVNSSHESPFDTSYQVPLEPGRIFTVPWKSIVVFTLEPMELVHTMDTTLRSSGSAAREQSRRDMTQVTVVSNARDSFELSTNT